MIGIIDYGMGNLRSVQKAFEHVGADAQILRTADEVAGVDKLVLPGVGAFADGMTHLRQGGWDEVIRSFVAAGKPMLGICLGMQLLLDSSDEDAPLDGSPVQGLGVVPGRVVRFQEDQGPHQPRLKVPHMGWNQIHWQNDPPLWQGMSTGDHVYFVHSYYCKPADASIVAATTEYGEPFCAALHSDNIWAVQFHPEKSQRVGLKILENFASL